MKKYTWIIILGFIAIGGYLYSTSEKKDDQQLDKSRLAVSNIDEIDKISIKDREGNKVILTKKNNVWYVNDKYKVFEPTMDLFLENTLSKIRIKGPVAALAEENVIRNMIAKSKHVIVSANGKEIQNYYVGKANPEQSGTYFHVDGSKTPYITHILGLGGVLYPKFSSIASDWYDRSIFDYKPQEISKITLTNYEIPEESFTLSRTDSAYTILPNSQLSQAAAKSYFALFHYKNYEGFAKYLTQESKDSIKKATPFMTVSVTSIDGTVKSLNIYKKGSEGQEEILLDKRGNVLVKDIERYFATFTGFDKLVTIQQYTFGKIITKRSFFSPAY